MEFRVLGPLEVVDDDTVLRLGGRKQRAVLASLLLSANHVVSVDALVEAVWGETPPERVGAVLQVYVANLRRLIEPDRADLPGRPRLIRRPPGYLLRVEPGELDLLRFEGLARSGRAALAAGAVEDACGLLREALALWRGEPFPDLGTTAFPPAEIGMLQDRRLGVLEDRIEADIVAGRSGELAGELGALIASYPLRERLRGQLMRVLYRSGRQAEALEVYRQTREILRDDLGIDPGPALQQLEQAVLRQDAALDVPMGSAPARFGLPVPASSLIGRDAELAALKVLVAQPGVRLVTLRGPGGTGKTRLAVELARTMLPYFPDGAYFVPLASLVDARLVMSTLAGALGVRENADRPLMQSLIGRLSERRLMLVLDNFEHVLAAATQIAELVAGAPAITVVITSRAALRIGGEHEYPVPPLQLPDLDSLPALAQLVQNEAVLLFVQRARAVYPRFELSEATTRPVATICHRMDGLPLAIELAAARVRVLPPPAMLARLTDRLRILTGGPLDAPARQRTLRATIEWSFDLLDADERTLFTRLAVFADGYGLDAVEAVCSGDLPIDALDGLDSLVGKSLLHPTSGPHDELRFVMLETIHAFAREALGASPDRELIRRRHAEYYAAMAESAAPELQTDRQNRTVHLLGAEHANLRAALRWSIETAGAAEIALRLCGTLWHFWEMCGHLTEGRRWLDAALAIPVATPPELRLKACTGAGTLAWLQGDYHGALALHQEALELARRVGDVSAEAFALNAMGVQFIGLQDYDRTVALCEEAHARALDAGDTRTATYAMHNLGDVARHRGHHERAMRLYQRCLEDFRELGDTWAVAVQLQILGITALHLGHDEGAGRWLRESLALGWQLGDKPRVVECLDGLAAVAARNGDPLRGARLLGAGAALREALGVPVPPAEAIGHDLRIRAIRAMVAPGAFAGAYAEGEHMTVHQAVDHALLPDVRD